MNHSISLSPAQAQALEWLRSAPRDGYLLHLYARTGCGRTTVLREFHRETGGSLLTIADFLQCTAARHPLALEDSLFDMLTQNLKQGDVMMDDFHLATAVMSGCHFYPRSGLLDAPLAAVAAMVEAAGSTLVYATDRGAPEPLMQRSYSFGIEKFQPADYHHLCCAFWKDRRADKIDFEKIHRFAPKLNAHQLKGACRWLESDKQVSTDRFIDYLYSQRLASNVDLSEVADVELSDLKGIDDVIRGLEANVVVPLENDALATELGLSPKRGVLLVGPPGTGKTTVGRALAHRLKGKFFLIDGTIISGTERFYSTVHRVFQLAQENAPAVIFIDDSDVIFESGQEHGLYRYLLTMLDGLESQSAGRVCVMLTAMDVGNLPPAMIRSGRVELWLEMQLPNAAARGEILEGLVDDLPEQFRSIDRDAIVTATDSFTGADLKRTIEDGKALYGYDRAKGHELQAITQYFLDAIETVRINKQNYARAAAQAKDAQTTRPPWFNVHYEPDFDDED